MLEEQLDNFERSVLRVRRLIELHKGIHGKQGRPPQQVSDVLRGASVLAAGALDGLILEVIVAATPEAARRGLLGQSAIRWAADDAARLIAAFAKENPHEELAGIVRDKLARTTFQKSAMIESNLRDVLKRPASDRREDVGR